MKNLLGVWMLCAASAAIAQPEMSKELYLKLAGDWYLTDQCAFGGYIKPETAAYGKHLLRQSLDRYQTDMAAFTSLVNAFRKKQKNGLTNTKVCNVIAVQIEEIRLQVADAEAKVEAQAQADAKQQRDAQANAERRQRQLRDEQMAAQAEAYRQQQIREANVAQNNREVEKLEQQFRDFGNSFRPQTTNCTRTMMGASCTTY